MDLNKVELANDDPLLKHHSPLFQIVRTSPMSHLLHCARCACAVCAVCAACVVCNANVSFQGRVLRFDPPPDYESEIAPDLPVFQPQTAPKKRWHKQTMPAVSEDPYVRCLARETDPGIEVVLSSGCVCQTRLLALGMWSMRATHDTTRHDTTRHDTTRHDTTRHSHDVTQFEGASPELKQFESLALWEGEEALARCLYNQGILALMRDRYYHNLVDFFSITLPEPEAETDEHIDDLVNAMVRYWRPHIIHFSQRRP